MAIARVLVLGFTVKRAFGSALMFKLVWVSKKVQKVQLRDKVVFSFRFAIANCEATYNALHTQYIPYYIIYIFSFLVTDGLYMRGMY